MNKWVSIAKEAERQQEKFIRHLNYQTRLEERDNESEMVIRNRLEKDGVIL